MRMTLWSVFGQMFRLVTGMTPVGFIARVLVAAICIGIIGFFVIITYRRNK